jgi:DNA-directed RNA polymerase subunit M/transcription elongation factor TFIIS
MGNRVQFETDCPNNHNQTVSFSQEQFEEALKSDTLMLHCNTCDANWPPSKDEIARLRAGFKKTAHGES